MNAGFSGAFVIAWAQTETDGQAGAAVSALRVGMEWRWSGQAVRVDGPASILPLCSAMGESDLHQRAAASLQKRSGARGATRPGLPEPLDTALRGQGFTVTDGRRLWNLSVVSAGSDPHTLVLCLDGLPPRNCDLWVVHHTLTVTPAPTKGVICFTPGTLIQTETGSRRVEHLNLGDRIQTKDNGCAPILWIGRRHVTGARLYAMPQLRPVSFRPGALDQGVPQPGLVLSPDHRIVLRGPRARALFNCNEVLVKARDLINDHTVLTDYSLREVTYIHLLLAAHQVVFANGVETESFHPASADLSTVDPHQLSDLTELFPAVARDPQAYGHYARRVLSASEAAIFRPYWA